MILMEGKVLDTKHSVCRNAFNTLIIQICSTKQESVKTSGTVILLFILGPTRFREIKVKI